MTMGGAATLSLGEEGRRVLDEGAKVRRAEGLRARGEGRGERGEERKGGSGSVNKREIKKRGKQRRKAGLTLQCVQRSGRPIERQP